MLRWSIQYVSAGAAAVGFETETRAAYTVSPDSIATYFPPNGAPIALGQFSNRFDAMLGCENHAEGLR